MARGEMRVLHVEAGREYRGGQNQARLLAEGLAGRAGLRQAVLTRAGSRLAREMEAAGLPVIGVPWAAGLDPRAVAAIARALPDRDVAHAHSSHGLQALVLARAISGAGARLVASRRVGTAPGSPPVWRRADVVLAVSGVAREALLRVGLEPARVRVVHDAVATDDLRPQRPGVLRRAAGAEEGELLVGAAGALTQEKGHRTLVRAFARVAEARPGARLVIAGEGPLEGELEALAAGLGVGDRVALPGRLPEVARSMTDLDVYVMPSRDEGLGVATAEAMWLGVPAVVTTAGGLPELAGGVLPTVRPEDPEAMASQILRLAGDPELRRRVGEAAAEHAAGFTVEAMAAGTLAGYRAAVESAWKRRAHLRRARGRPVPPPPDRVAASAAAAAAAEAAVRKARPDAEAPGA